MSEKDELHVRSAVDLLNLPMEAMPDLPVTLPTFFGPWENFHPIGESTIYRKRGCVYADTVVMDDAFASLLKSEIEKGAAIEHSISGVVDSEMMANHPEMATKSSFRIRGIDVFAVEPKQKKPGFWRIFFQILWKMFKGSGPMWGGFVFVLTMTLVAGTFNWTWMLCTLGGLILVLVSLSALISALNRRGKWP